MNVIAPTEVSDDKLVQVRDVITSTLSERSDLLDALAADHARIAIYPDNQDAGGSPSCRNSGFSRACH